MGSATTVGDLLARARALGVARLDAQLLLARRLGRPRAWLIAHEDAAVAATDSAALEQDLRRRAGGTPLAYIVGEREFHGLVLQVSPAVLVPRPETEGLVDWALNILARAEDAPAICAGPATAAPTPPTPQVVDLGTGSGAIALAVKHGHPAAQVTATDASQEALAVAQANAARLGLQVAFVAGSWWNPLADRRFDLALSNPPYVAEGDPHLAALDDEPIAALTPGGDGLAALRQIVAAAPAHLNAGAWLLLEHGFDQDGAVRALLADAGFERVETRADLAGLPRTTGGQWPGRAGA
jgi:release factor glutamine methyltransferase